MKIVPVERLEIVECVYNPNRPVGTFVTLRADGMTSYTLFLQGRRSPSSGEHTVVAYPEVGPYKIRAWLDPRSGEFFCVNLNAPPAGLMGATFALLLAAIAAARHEFSPVIVFSLAVAVVASGATAVWRGRVASQRLEMAMRKVAAA